MEIFKEAFTVVSEAKDWVILVASVAFMFIFWEPIARRLGWKGRDDAEIVEIEKKDLRETAVLQGLFGEMRTLSQHFNHDTSKVLEEIRDTLKDNFKEIHGKHAEWDKYGIKTDCDKK